MSKSGFILRVRIFAYLKHKYTEQILEITKNFQKPRINVPDVFSDSRGI